MKAVVFVGFEQLPTARRQPVELLLPPGAHLEDSAADQAGERVALALAGAGARIGAPGEARSPVFSAFPATVQRDQRALGDPGVGGIFGGSVHRPQDPLSHGKALIEGAEHEVALILGLELQPLFHHVAVQRQVFAAELDDAVHHQEIQMEGEELGLRFPDLREEGVHRLLIVSIDLVALRQAGGVLIDVGREAGDREVEGRTKRPGVHEAHVRMAEGRQDQLFGELLKQPVDQRFGDDEEVLAVLFRGSDHHAPVREDHHGALPLALVTAEGQDQLAQELVAMGDSAGLQQRRQGLAVALVELLEETAQAASLGDRPGRQLDHPILVGHALGLTAEALVEGGDQMLRHAVQPLLQDLELDPCQASTSRGSGSGLGSAGAGGPLLERIAPRRRNGDGRTGHVDLSAPLSFRRLAVVGRRIVVVVAALGDQNVIVSGPLGKASRRVAVLGVPAVTAATVSASGVSASAVATCAATTTPATATLAVIINTFAYRPIGFVSHICLPVSGARRGTPAYFAAYSSM